MKASQLLGITIGVDQGVGVTQDTGGAVVITARYPNERGACSLRFVGASCPASAKAGARDLSSITLHIPAGKKNQVVALYVYGHEAKCSDHILNLLLTTSWVNDRLVIDCDRPFVPSNGCLGQVSHLVGSSYSTDLAVSVDGKTFATCHADCGEKYTERKAERMLAEGYAIVPDGGLLCRFLVGEATLEQVEAAVIAEPVNVAELQLKVLQLEVDLEEARREVGNRQRAVDGFMDVIDCRVAERNAKQSLIEDMQRWHGEDLLKLSQMASNDGYEYTKWGGFPWIARKKMKDYLDGLLLKNMTGGVKSA